MKRTALTVAILVFLSGFLVIIAVLPEVRATTLYVGGGGLGNYTTIQEAIDDANPGDTIFVYNGTYLEHVTVSETVTLVGEGTDSTTISGQGLHDVVLVTADWVNITGFTLTGSGSTVYHAGVTLERVDNCRIEGNNLSGNSGSGIYLNFSEFNVIVGNSITSNHGNGIHVASSPNNRIIDNVISDNSGYGIAIPGGNNVDLINNTVRGSGRIGITTTGYYQTIVNNTVSSNGDHGIALYGRNCLLRNNTLTGDGILAGSNTHDIDLSNTVNGKPVYYWKNVTGGIIPPGAGEVILANCTGVQVKGQNLSDSSVGIQLTHSSNNTIANNIVNYADVMGMYLSFSDNNTITNSTFLGSEEAIYIWASDYNLVASNNISESRIGIHIEMSDGTRILGNAVTSSELYGMRVYRSSYGEIAGNALSDNRYGVYLRFESNNNTISGNSLQSSLFRGVYLSDTNGNMLYHNRFLNNTNQARDWNGTNRWDDGYPSGGNYWSDFSGTDWYRGPGQDIPGSDGIGDTPYGIDTDGIDRYPLVSIGVTYPNPPLNATASLSGKDFENVTISWDPPPDESLGLVDRYDILRGEIYNTTANLYTNIGSVPNGTHQFVAALDGEGNPNTYYFAVCATNMTNDLTCADDQAAKFTLPLSPGPNLISIPLIQSDASIETVLQTVRYDRAWYFDSLSGWEWYTKHKGYRRGLWSVNHTMGLWVNVTEDSNLTAAGVVPLQTTIRLHKGWNLVSFPSINTSFTVGDLKASLPIERVEGFDPSALPHFLRVLSDSDVLLAGRAYWVKAQADVVWNVPFE